MWQFVGQHHSLSPKFLSRLSYPKLDPYHGIGPAKYQIDESCVDTLVLIGMVLFRQLAY